jgi:hypothetical protein
MGKSERKINQLNKKPNQPDSRMKKLVFSTIAIGALAVAASAAPVTLTFEGLQDQETILDYYNGGFGGSGSGPGPNYGVSFTADSLALISRDNGGSGNFSGSLAPSPHTIAFFLSGAGDTMNVAGGFDTGFSFFYSSPFYAGAVTVWSGLNGTGTLLADIILPTTTTYPGAPYPYDAWAPAGLSFSGTAESAIFAGVANQIGFDNITLGSATPGGTPDGGVTAMLLGAGLLGLAGLRRKLS